MKEVMEIKGGRKVILGGDPFLLTILSKQELDKARNATQITDSMPDFYKSSGEIPGSLTYSRQTKNGKSFLGYYRFFEVSPLIVCWQDGTVMGGGGEYPVPWQPALVPLTRDGKSPDEQFWRDNPVGSISFGGCLQVDNDYYGYFSAEKLPEVTEKPGVFDLVDMPENAGGVDELMWVSTGSSLVCAQPIVDIPLCLLFAHQCLPMPYLHEVK